MRLTGGQIVVETLINEGVPYIVGIPGHGTLGFRTPCSDRTSSGCCRCGTSRRPCTWRMATTG